MCFWRCYSISGDSVRVDPEKIQAIMEWPKPITVSTLVGFLGLTGYYRHFVRQYAGIASPLFDLLKSQQFRWNERAEVAFKELKDTMTPIQTPKQHKWLTKLMGYDYEIIYKPGKENKVADALSRVQTYSYAAIIAPEFTWLSALREYFTTKPKGMDFLQKVKSDHILGFTIHDGLIYFNGRLYIHAEAELRQQLLAEYHTSPLSGHLGNRATLVRMASSFFWPAMSKDVLKFISSMAFLKPSSQTETHFSYLSFGRNCFVSLAPNSTTSAPTTLSLMAKQRPPPTVPSYIISTSKNASIDATLTHRDQLLSELKQALSHSQQAMMQQANKKRRDVKFEEAHEIDLLATSRIHDVFHISRLCHCLDNPPKPTFLIPATDEDDKPISNTAPIDCTWEDVEELRCSHPSLFSDIVPSVSVGLDDSSLVDKAKVMEGGIVKRAQHKPFWAKDYVPK
ncbi:hypothetical protein F3Y22_tig00110384pilonHSYRG00614 [Hibiscus syriacus]|uniref:Integrase zinc-binding domain-containing protein n=1 Tax=Hibiscus syriacus TaxID=106335 RepID=A0A6A3ARM1_HIBSY|nr:hypothetical protein F3Y22_tig00110384pilonHSYRG00614 [Hibiscus syriacus]